MDTDDFKVKVPSYQTDKSQSIRKMWEIMAQRPSDFDMEVIEALKNTVNASSNTEVNNKKYGCYGETMYLIIRDEYLIKYKNADGKKICFLNNKDNKDNKDNEPIIDSNILLTDEKKLEKKLEKKVVKKADIILQNATINKIHERMKKIMSSFNILVFTQPGEFIMKSDILDIRAIGFIYMAWYLITYYEQYIEKEDRIFPFSIIVSLQRFIKAITNYNGFNVANPATSIVISSTLLKDLQYLEAQLIELYEFNGVSLYQMASDLIMGCPLDIYLPKQYRSAFKHQIRVSRTLLDIDLLRNGFMMFYRTMTNSGKTSSIINITACVEYLRKTYEPVFGNLQVIATCDVNPVLTRWGQLLYHAGYPFGIASKRYYPSNTEIAAKILIRAKKEMQEDTDCVDTEMRFSNSDTCASIKDRLVIICTPDIALKILTKAPNPDKRFILLHDEPTMYAENINSKELQYNMAIFKHAPKWSIFSSATLPYDVEKTQIFLNNHKQRFPNAVFIDNCSSEIYSCCNIRTYDGCIIVPHMDIQNRDELDIAIEHIKNNPFLGKLYTPTSAGKLYQKAVAVGRNNREFVQRVPRLPKIFNNVENLYPDKIRLLTINILESLKVLTDTQIKEICSRDSDDRNSEDSDSDSDSNSEDSDSRQVRDTEGNASNVKYENKKKKYIYPKDINFNELGTREAGRFPYLNLVASDQPDIFMNMNYKLLLDDVKTKIGSLDKLQYEHKKLLTTWQKEYDSLEGKIKNADMLSKKQSEMYDNKPSLIYPEECQINTRRHIYKYSRNNLPPNYQKRLRVPITLPTDELDDIHITDNIKLGILSGVCCYGSPETTNLDEDYLNMALDLTSQKKMEALIADSSICYGTDYPIGGVIITPEFSKNHSINTLYQLMSRAGRGRKSSNAEIYVDNKCADKILETVKLGNKAVCKEIENMITVFMQS